jgi:hypothetical protein
MPMGSKNRTVTGFIGIENDWNTLAIDSLTKLKYLKKNSTTKLEETPSHIQSCFLLFSIVCSIILAQKYVVPVISKRITAYFAFQLI